VVRLKEDALQVLGPVGTVSGDVEPAEVYGCVEDYDPVLRAHCRVAEE
jgi:hypothetical protein